ncbi:MAG: ubiquinone biosynthesis protein UbiJ [Neptuniibacter pectenicola]|jgi:ubiquinone biosynthesis protein UbiJ|uniref:ubiquinone biosynthesis accessory factor UbiJ n=1 Tax=Neptuniibacter pectenicola TaxID=1806669 RepID=UPI0030EE3F9A|tara:strand:+ start:5523 stop:6140 length:618 start_codon:yes stop_codon:yes gene_type:complete
MIEMLQATLFTTAEEICNQLLKRDPVTLQHLERLSGKVIAIELTQPQLSLFLLPNADGLQLQSIYNDTPDTILSGRAIDFLTLITRADRADAMFGKTIQITGDTVLATRLQEILADAQIDWEAMIANLIGELPAHQLALYASWKAQWYKNAGTSALQNLDEYLKEEFRVIPTRPEVNKFYSEVDTLRERVERLSARIAAKAANLG